MSKILVTGGSGSAGSYLCQYLASLGHDVIGTTRGEDAIVDHVTEFRRAYRLKHWELTEPQFILLRHEKPDYIFNLAANADVRGSFNNPIWTLDNNIKSTAQLLDAVQQLKKLEGYDPIIQHCSTSEVYGLISQEDCPVSETYPIKPVNVYAVSKLAQEQLALAYNKMYGLKVIVTRAFGYINPRRKNIFSTAFARQIVEIEKGKRQFVEHGNLDSVRTLMDVRDIAKAYWLAAIRGRVGEIYNIGSTQPISVKDFLTILISKTDRTIACEENPDLIRPIDVTLQIPDTRKFLSETGFFPEYTLDQSINWLLEECRNVSE
jgi:GDP-4-dehydro-6-deoxy-D-mannose reductase